MTTTFENTENLKTCLQVEVARFFDYLQKFILETVSGVVRMRKDQGREETAGNLLEESFGVSSGKNHVYMNTIHTKNQI